jgi:hypothetical protein
MNASWKSNAPRKSLRQPLWIICALSGALAALTGCGPQQAFCPTTGTNDVCPIQGDDAKAPPPEDAGSICPGGGQAHANPDGNGIICS